MFAKITRGDRMVGLMSYLQGPGKRDEHERPHVVAGDPGAVAWYADGELSEAKAKSLGKYLDRPSRVHNEAKVTAGVYEQVPAGRDSDGQREFKRERVGERDAHVYHVSLSARAEEGQLGDDVWRELAEQFVTRMELVSGADDVRWVAVHHGQSAAGNDHIHLAINLVRESGSTVDVHHDFIRAKRVCRELETEYGLMPLHPNEYDLARTYARKEWEATRRDEQETGAADPRIPWWELSDEEQQDAVRRQFGSAAEWESARAAKDIHGGGQKASPWAHQGGKEALAKARARAAYERRLEDGSAATPWPQLSAAARASLVSAAMPVEDPTQTLRRHVRAAATASADEAEFVRRVRQQGLLIRPRFAAGQPDVVEGYSVAQRPAVKGERPIWRGGYRLGADLSLPRLREQWSTASADAPAAAAEAAQAAVDEWRAAKKGHRPARVGREQQHPSPVGWQRIQRQLNDARDRLRRVDPGATHEWQLVARECAGTFAAWSTAVEAEPGPLAATAEELSRAAEVRREPESRPASMPSVAGGALLVLAASRQGPVAQLAVMRAFLGLTKAVVDAQRVRGEALAARRLENVVRSQLATVVARMDEQVAKVPAASVPRHPETAAEEAARLERTANVAPPRPGSPPVPGAGDRAARRPGEPPVQKPREKGTER